MPRFFQEKPSRSEMTEAAAWQPGIYHLASDTEGPGPPLSLRSLEMRCSN
jgi:hypothetical protein